MKFFDRFLTFLKSEKRYSPHTILAYQTDLSQFQEFALTAYEQEEIDHAPPSVVRSWIVHLMEEELDSRSVNRKISSLKSYYRFLMREGVISQTPMSKITAPKVAKKLPSFVPEKDMEFLFADIEFGDGYEGSRDRFILELLYATGIRRDELIKLKLYDVDRQSGTIKVTGKRSKERIIPLHSRLMTVIDEYLVRRSSLQSEEPYLFLASSGGKMYPQLIYRLVRKYLQQVTTIKKKSPHILRHTFATHMLNNGADLNSIKELLGHANLSATQVYTHNSMEKLKHIYKQAHPKA